MLRSASATQRPAEEACAFHHHRVALETGFMTEPCRQAVKDGQPCCAHNELGNVPIRQKLERLQQLDFVSAEQNERLRLALHHAQRDVFVADINVNYMVYLCLLQDGTGAVCGTDETTARGKERMLRAEIGLAPRAPWRREAIDEYARRSQAELGAPILLISELADDLIAKSGSTAPSAARRRIGRLLDSMPAELSIPLAHPEESPWFQPLKRSAAARG